ncbi:MAG TPA: bifunctional diguanylate cyclase/phosphodiesterase [Rhizomicrobium sp.]
MPDTAQFLRSALRVLLVVLAMLSIAPAYAGTANFAAPKPVLDLSQALSTYHAANGNEADGSQWFMITAVNPSERPFTRILLAEQPADAMLRLFPRRARTAIRQVAASDSSVIVENAHAYGRYAFRVTVPAASSVALAIRLANADDSRPSISAWTEPALAGHNRQLAVFFAAVAGLIAAALAIVTGLAIMTGHAAPRWAAFTLAGVFLSRLAASGLFDAMGPGGIGGPDGVSAMLSGLTLAAGVRLAVIIAPVPEHEPMQRNALLGIVFVSVLAFIGVPIAMLATEIAVVAGAALIAAHLVRQGLAGAQAARVAAPSGVIFALVAMVGAISALGGFQANPAAPGVIGGFAATAAVLLALAVAAGEGIAILPARRRTAPAATPPQDFASSQAAQAIGASYQGMFDVDIDNASVLLSAEASALMGGELRAETLAYAAWLDRLYPDDRSVFDDAIREFGERKGLAFRVEFRAFAGAERPGWYELRATTLDDGTLARRCLGLLADISARKEAEPAPSPHRARDGLTGLPNRVALLEDLERLARNLDTVTLAILDVDRFKAIHASLGDAGGDSVLVQLAQRLKGLATGGNRVFRVGGDAFVLLAPQTRLSVSALGDRILSVCSEPHTWNSRSIYAPASIGLALGKDARDPDELVRNAELALLHAKREGGACARAYRRELVASAPPDPVALETALREGLKRGELDLCFQPIIRLADNSLAGFEALLRWNHRERGTLSPADFIEHAERTGLILELGRFALERTAEALAQWQREFPLPRPLFASVNVSRRQLTERKFERAVAHLIETSGLTPGTLKLEVTESAVWTGTDMTEVLDRLRGCGAGLAIDDFGTGLSTLSQLKDVPFDTVKIDRSFLARHGTMPEEPGGTVVLRSVVNLAHELGRVVVVEGVETEAAAQWLTEIGCDFAQGFYFSAPLAREEADAHIRARCPLPDVPAPSGVAAMGSQN